VLACVRDNSRAWRSCVRILASLPVLLRGRMWLPGQLLWVIEKNERMTQCYESVYTSDLVAPVVACTGFHCRSHTLTRGNTSALVTPGNACYRGGYNLLISGG
jgi:hypothetical protein